MTNKILSIVVLCYNKFNFTRSCLKDLSKLPDDHEIVLINNGSSDETHEEMLCITDVMPGLQDKLVYHKEKVNGGFAYGSNKGYQLATAPNVCFLNNDIRINKDHSTWTQQIIQHCDRYVVGPTMGQLDNRLNFVKEANEVLPGNSYMSGWCIASSKKIWNSIYGDGKVFDEDFFCYFEDSNLGFICREKGIPFKVVDIPVVHFGKTSSKQLNVPVLYKQAQKIFIKKWSKLIK